MIRHWRTVHKFLWAKAQSPGQLLKKIRRLMQSLSAVSNKSADTVAGGLAIRNEATALSATIEYLISASALQKKKGGC